MQLSKQEKRGLYRVLNALPTEVDGLKRALINKTIDGSIYSSESGHGGACLIGTVCPRPVAKQVQKLWDNHGNRPVRVVTPAGSFIVNGTDSPIEDFVIAIRPGRRDSEFEDTRNDYEAHRLTLLEAVVEWELKFKAAALKRLGRKKLTFDVSVKGV